MTEIHKSTGSCQPGDSGGPTYSRAYPDGSVLARGEIVGYADDSGENPPPYAPLGDYCYYDPLYDIDATFNVQPTVF